MPRRARQTSVMPLTCPCGIRNQIAHGLMDPEIILEQGIYLWWLAIKMVFCEKEIFTKKRNRS